MSTAASRRRVRGRAGLALALASIVFMFGSLAIPLPEDDRDGVEFFGIGGVLCGILLSFRARQRANLERSSTVHRGAKPDVLYLRSFESDVSSAYRGLRSGFSTDEEQLADAVEPIGELVAVGKPREQLPPPGAARVYFSDGEWQQRVGQRLREAHLIVLRVGAGRGLRWEVRETFRSVSPERVLLWVWDVSSRDYAAFCEAVRQDWPFPLPSPPRLHRLRSNLQDRLQNAFITFARDGRPTLALVRLPRTMLGFNDHRGPLRDALRPVFDVLKVPWRPLGRFD